MSSIQAQIPVFSDTFENGSTTDSEPISNFWSPVIPSNCTVTETGGQLVMTAGDTASGNGVYSTYQYSATSDDFNFFKRKLCFSADMSVTGNYGGVSFGLTGVAGSGYTVEDVLSLSFNVYNAVSLATKQDKANASSSTYLVNNVSLPGKPSRFELTLDGVNYTLVVYYSGGSQTFTGTHGLVGAQWGTDEKTSVQFATTRGSGGSLGAGITVTGTIDNFLVMSYATAAVFEDCFNNGVVANSDAETAIWTSTLPYTSTVSELTGALVQTAGTSVSGTDFILTNVHTPLQSRFNFFDQKLKISATVTVTGSCSAQWMERARMALASEASNSGTADDALVVGFRAQNSVSLMVKSGGAYVQPDNTTSAVNKYPLNGMEGFGVFSGPDIINGFALTVDSKRYQLIAYNPGKGCGIIRFSGSHGIDRTKWGSNGDSSLMLETIRISETSASAVTQTTWDNLRVEKSNLRMLDEPFSSLTATYSRGGTSYTSSQYYIWLPKTEPVIRGIIFVAPGDGDDCRYIAADYMMQEAARSIGFGIIGYNYDGRMNLGIETNPYRYTSLIHTAVQQVLSQAATATGHPEIANAPLCITGFSRGSFDSGALALTWPERVVAFVPQRGGTWVDATLSSGLYQLTDAAKKVPGLFCAGSFDGNGATDPVAMKPMFNWWRGQGAQVAYVVDWYAGHTMRGNQGWEGVLTWMVEVANLRYPRPMVPSYTPGALPTLLNIDTTSGWLGDNDTFSTVTHSSPTSYSAFTPIAPYASYSGTVSTASWLPNEACARMYRAMNSSDMGWRSGLPLQSALRIVNPPQFPDPVVAGNSVTIQVDPRDFDNTNSLTSMDFYDGATWLGAVTSGPAWQWTYTPAAGAHTVTAVATDVLGNKRDAFRNFYVQLADYPPVVYGQGLALMSGNSSSGTVTAFDPEGNTVTLSATQQPAHGTLSLDSSTGAYTYSPNAGYAGTDSFAIAASDGTLTGSPTVFSVAVDRALVGDIASVTAAPGTTEKQITLTWSAASDASYYLIERSTTNSSGFAQIATISAPVVTYTDSSSSLLYYSSPTSLNTYYYRLMAFNSVSNSTYSSIVSSQPYNTYSLVGTIDSITAVPGTIPGEVIVTWSAAANATAYRVEAASTWSDVTASTPLSYYVLANVTPPNLTATESDITANLPCYYRVMPYNPGRVGTYSAVVTSKPYLPPTMDGWRYLIFGSTEILLGTTGDLDSPSGDGVTNIMRCALGIGVYVNNDINGEYLVTPPTSMPYVMEQTVNGVQYLTCSFTHSKTATDLVVRVEVTDDPKGTWTQLDPFDTTNQVSVTDNTPSDGIETIVVKDTQPTSAATKRFMRVRVTHP